MKLFKLALILLLFFNSFPANASRDNDNYDGNIFSIYAGNGSIVPPKTTLKESLKKHELIVF